ncbi:MAG TPA: serine hydrolase domain-containing protein [Bryobacteraceae bacterium]|jgi:CubicO group peptidase (beta-lactamase class C family)
MRLFAVVLLPFLLLAQSPDAVDALFEDYSRPGVPGASVIVIRDGKVLYKHSYGMADLEAAVRATPATNYRLASITKQFTAMSILMLAERKQLSLDDPLTKFFPGYPAYGKAITVRHLLTHTSGLKPYEDLMPPSQTAQIKDREVLELLEHQTTGDFPAGSEWRYSNTGYAHLAMIVEKVSSMSFAAFLKKNIFDPLHMDGTVAFEDGISTVRNRAYGYSAKGAGFERTDQSTTSAVLGDGGIYSSVEDLYRWDQALYTTKLVSAETLRQAFTPAVLTSGKATTYGFGWEIGEDRDTKTVRHSGSTIGFRTEILRNPERKFTVVILTNRNGGSPAQIANRIAALYIH